MRIQTTLQNDELHIVHPPTAGARIFGLIFLGAGAFMLYLIAMDTFTKVSNGDISALFRSIVSVLIVLAMTGIPGLLFGFQTNRVRMNKLKNEVVATRDFVVFKHNRTYPSDQFDKVDLKHRTETSRQKRANRNTYRTRTHHYYDVALFGNKGQYEVVDTVPAKEVDTARQVAREIAYYLQVEYKDEAYMDAF